MDLSDAELRIVLDLMVDTNHEWQIEGDQRRLARRIARHLNEWPAYLSVVAPRAYETMKDRAMQRLDARPDQNPDDPDWYDRLSLQSKKYNQRIGAMRRRWADTRKRMPGGH